MSNMRIEQFSVEGKYVNLFNTGEQHANFRTTVFYENKSSEDITIVQRNNLPVIIPGSNEFRSREGVLIIRTAYNFNGKNTIVSTINALDFMHQHHKMMNKELLVIREMLLDYYHKNNVHSNIRNCVINIDREVPCRYIRNHGAVYITDADVMVISDHIKEHIPHPYSSEGVTLDNYNRIASQNSTNGIFIDLIDNENKISNRYMYVAKQVIEVVPRVDKSRASGLYLVRTETDSHGYTHMEPEFVDLEVAEESVGLYPTQEEAITGGDPDSIIRIEQAKLKLGETRAEIELSEFKRKANIEKQEYEREKNRSDENLRILQAKLDEAKAVRTDYYEDRSHVRKDSSEAWKYIATAAVTGLGLYAAFLKANQQSK